VYSNDPVAVVEFEGYNVFGPGGAPAIFSTYFCVVLGYKLCGSPVAAGKLFTFSGSPRGCDADIVWFVMASMEVNLFTKLEG
jgi:hypothetical protein